MTNRENLTRTAILKELADTDPTVRKYIVEEARYQIWSLLMMDLAIALADEKAVLLTRLNECVRHECPDPDAHQVKTDPNQESKVDPSSSSPVGWVGLTKEGVAEARQALKVISDLIETFPHEIEMVVGGDQDSSSPEKPAKGELNESQLKALQYMHEHTRPLGRQE